MSFLSLGPGPELVRAVSGKGCDSPTPIQAKAIPLIFKGRDIGRLIKREIPRQAASGFAARQLPGAAGAS